MENPHSALSKWLTDENLWKRLMNGTGALNDLMKLFTQTTQQSTSKNFTTISLKVLIQNSLRSDSVACL